MEQGWKAHMREEFEKDYFKVLTEFIRQEYATKVIYPPAKLIFNTFR